MMQWHWPRFYSYRTPVDARLLPMIGRSYAAASVLGRTYCVKWASIRRLP